MSTDCLAYQKFIQATDFLDNMIEIMLTDNKFTSFMAENTSNK